MFVCSQQRITLNNIDYYVGMVFYNKFLKSYVLIDLKMNKLKAENLGQMNMYLNYYEKNVNAEDDDKPIGIILSTEKDQIVLEYALGGLLLLILELVFLYVLHHIVQFDYSSQYSELISSMLFSITSIVFFAKKVPLLLVSLQ